MSAHCCDIMQENVEKTCHFHADRHDCPDCLIEYRPAARKYGILVHDGGSSMISIRYCPWCGAALPGPDKPERQSGDRAR